MADQSRVVAPDVEWPGFASLVPSGELNPPASDMKEGHWKASSQYGSPSPEQGQTEFGPILQEKASEVQQ